MAILENSQESGVFEGWGARISRYAEIFHMVDPGLIVESSSPTCSSGAPKIHLRPHTSTVNLSQSAIRCAQCLRARRTVEQPPYQFAASDIYDTAPLWMPRSYRLQNRFLSARHHEAALFDGNPVNAPRLSPERMVRALVSAAFASTPPEYVAKMRSRLRLNCWYI